jgi:flagellar export protein FliJ
VREQEEIAAQAKEAWLLARQETKKVTTLREQQYDAWVKDQLRKEQKILDDMRSHLPS